MLEQDEFRIKLLTRLRGEGGRRIPALDLLSTAEQVAIARAMRKEGWIGVTGNGQGVKLIWITLEGRRILRLFEKMYR
jgi:hypothetical protein